MSQRDPENYKPCIIMAEGLFATLYWAQFLEMDILFSQQVHDEKSMPKQLLRLKGHHVWDDVSFRAMP